MASGTTDDGPVIAVPDSAGAAEATVKSLSLAGFDMGKVSIIGKGDRGQEHAVGFYSVGDTIRAWGAVGGFWGAVWGLVAGPAVFLVPRVGLVAAAGPVLQASLPVHQAA